MSKKKKNRDKEYTILNCVAMSLLTVVIAYIIFAGVLAFAVSSGSLNTRFAHYAAVAAIGVSCFVATGVNIRKNRGKRFVITGITAGIVICILILLPIADGEAIKTNMVWQSIASSGEGCVVALLFTRSIKQQKKRR